MLIMRQCSQWSYGMQLPIYYLSLLYKWLNNNKDQQLLAGLHSCKIAIISAVWINLKQVKKFTNLMCRNTTNACAGNQNFKCIKFNNRLSIPENYSIFLSSRGIYTTLSKTIRYEPNSNLTCTYHLIN